MLKLAGGIILQSVQILNSLGSPATFLTTRMASRSSISTHLLQNHTVGTRTECGLALVCKYIVVFINVHIKYKV